MLLLKSLRFRKVRSKTMSMDDQVLIVGRAKIPEETENNIVDKVTAAAAAGFPTRKRPFLIGYGLAWWPKT